MGGEKEQSNALNDYAGHRARFEQVDRDGLTGSRSGVPSMRPIVFIFMMKISVVWSDLVGRVLRAWPARWPPLADLPLERPQRGHSLRLGGR